MGSRFLFEFARLFNSFGLRQIVALIFLCVTFRQASAAEERPISFPEGLPNHHGGLTELSGLDSSPSKDYIVAMKSHRDLFRSKS